MSANFELLLFVPKNKQLPGAYTADSIFAVHNRSRDGWCLQSKSQYFVFILMAITLK